MRGRESTWAKKQALVDLNAVLVALPMSGLRIDLGSRRDQSRNDLRRRVDEVVEAPERRAAFGQAIVDLLDMSGEKGFARRVRVRQQRLRSRPFRFVPPRLRRQPPKESRRATPEGAVVASIGLKLASRDREGLGPFLRLVLRQAGCAHLRKGELGRRRHAFGLLSMTRFALPSDRSICPGASTLTFAVVPMRSFIACASFSATCSRASFRSEADLAST